MWLWLTNEPYIKRHDLPHTYHAIILLLCELIGMHPKYDINEDWIQMLRNAGWRKFTIERYTGD